MAEETTPSPAPEPLPEASGAPEASPTLQAGAAPSPSEASDLQPATAEDLAAEALAAAQAAINELGSSSGGGSKTPAKDGGAKSTEPTSSASSAPAQKGDGGSTSAQAAAAPLPDNASAFTFQPFGASSGKDVPENISLLSDVHLNVKIELGRTRMFVEDVLKLGEGCVVELDKLAGDPVDVYVNERHVARGEVLVVNDNFCVRINEIIAPAAAEGPARGAA